MTGIVKLLGLTFKGQRNDLAPQAAVHVPGMWAHLEDSTGEISWLQSGLDM